MLQQVAAAVDAIAEILLALAGVYVAGTALRGWRLERRAERAPADEKRGLIADAKARYAIASLQKPWVLLFLLVGGSVKAVLAFARLL